MVTAADTVTSQQLNFSLRGATFKYEELLIALESNIIDKASTAPIRSFDPTATMDIGMAAKDDSHGSRINGDRRIMDIALQAEYRGTGKGNRGAGEGPSWNTGGNDANRGGKRADGKKGGEETAYQHEALSHSSLAHRTLARG